MVLPDNQLFCDCIELAAFSEKKQLSDSDLVQIFAPGNLSISQKQEVEALVSDLLELAQLRDQRSGGGYPFEATASSIEYRPVSSTLYLILLHGTALKLGGRKTVTSSVKKFEKYFEDLVCSVMRSSGFLSEVLSIPREPRGMPKKLPDALRELTVRFGNPATLRPDRVTSDDNDLGVDVIATPTLGDGVRVGLPTIAIQCATGDVNTYSPKLTAEAEIFPDVWESGFSRETLVRSLATPKDLLPLSTINWNRLCIGGWILDRTRLVSMEATSGNSVPPPYNANRFLESLVNKTNDINWKSTRFS